MQQRRVRLGDVLDDYCPRERRITNHAVVAMIDDQVKQTRCATCDAEHDYKGAKVPAPRRKKAGGALPPDVPEALVRARPAAPAVDAPLDGDPADPELTAAPGEPAIAAPADDGLPPASAVQDEQDKGSGDEETESEEGAPHDEWVHRPLIRATLPRQEGQVPERKAPDFTMRQTGGRFDNNRDINRNGQRHGGPRPGRPGQGQFRQAQGQGQPGSRFGGPGQRPGSGQGSRHGQNPGQPQRQGPGPPGNRSGSTPGQRDSGRPGGPPRGPRQGSGPGRKRGR